MSEMKSRNLIRIRMIRMDHETIRIGRIRMDRIHVQVNETFGIEMTRMKMSTYTFTYSWYPFQWCHIVMVILVIVRRDLDIIEFETIRIETIKIPTGSFTKIPIEVSWIHDRFLCLSRGLSSIKLAQQWLRYHIVLVNNSGARLKLQLNRWR